MDCPSEENLIRMKLDGHQTIVKLDFRIEDRELTVYHEENDHGILSSLDTLALDTELVKTEETHEKVESDAKLQTKLLWQVLIINFVCLQSLHKNTSTDITLISKLTLKNGLRN